MDKLNRLKALTGEDKVSEDTSTQHNWGYQIKPRHLYEGTDSEDEEITTSRRSEIEPYPSNNYISTKSGRCLQSYFHLPYIYSLTSNPQMHGPMSRQKTSKSINFGKESWPWMANVLSRGWQSRNTPILISEGPIASL
jgi:hypothetical protein